VTGAPYQGGSSYATFLDVSIPDGEARASLNRLLSGIDDLSNEVDERTGAIDADELANAHDSVRQWQRDLNRGEITPNDLPRTYGGYASAVSGYPRLAKLFLGERRVLDAMDVDDYGHRSWRG